SNSRCTTAGRASAAPRLHAAGAKRAGVVTAPVRLACATGFSAAVAGTSVGVTTLHDARRRQVVQFEEV
ncbi:MAG: hypothetical protein ABSC93_30070, partial [Bryobacteraceae bacterium]